jgi:hypothetical protein
MEELVTEAEARALAPFIATLQAPDDPPPRTLRPPVCDTRAKPRHCIVNATRAMHHILGSRLLLGFKLWKMSVEMVPTGMLIGEPAAIIDSILSGAKGATTPSKFFPGHNLIACVHCVVVASDDDWVDVTPPDPGDEGRPLVFVPSTRLYAPHGADELLKMHTALLAPRFGCVCDSPEFCKQKGLADRDPDLCANTVDALTLWLEPQVDIVPWLTAADAKALNVRRFSEQYQGRTIERFRIAARLAVALMKSKGLWYDDDAKGYPMPPWYILEVLTAPMMPVPLARRLREEMTSSKGKEAFDKLSGSSSFLPRCAALVWNDKGTPGVELRLDGPNTMTMPDGSVVCGERAASYIHHLTTTIADVLDSAADTPFAVGRALTVLHDAKAVPLWRHKEPTRAVRVTPKPAQPASSMRGLKKGFLNRSPRRRAPPEPPSEPPAPPPEPPPPDADLQEPDPAAYAAAARHAEVRLLRAQFAAFAEFARDRAEARRQHVELVELHDWIAAAEERAARLLRKYHAEQSRAARDAEGERPTTPWHAPPTSKRAEKARARQTTRQDKHAAQAAAYEHAVHASDPQREIRARSFQAKQAWEEADAELRRLKARADRLRELERQRSAATAAARHVVPPPPSASDFVAAALDGVA